MLTVTPLSYPVVALCREDPTALDLKDWSFHLLQQFIGRVDVPVGQLRPLDLGLGGSCVGQLSHACTTGTNPPTLTK